MPEAVDAEAFKKQQEDDWDRAAPYWRRFDEGLRRGSTALTDRLQELAKIAPGQRVLDIGSGTGEPGLPAAELVGPSGFVLLTDQSSEMLAVARDKAAARDLHNVDFIASDAERLELEPKSFDAALCRGALCLMPNPVACLRLVREALKPGGRIAVSVVGNPQANPYFTTAALALTKYGVTPRVNPGQPGTFAFANPERLKSVLEEAGFREVHFEKLQHTSELGTGREYWEYVRGIGVIAALLEQVPADKHAEIGEDVATRAGGGDPDGEVSFPAESNLAMGVR